MIKKVIIAILIIALICGGIYGGLTVYRNSNQKPVAVYPVSDILLSPDYFMEDSQTYGSITADRMQSVYLSGTQKVRDVLVEEGQPVRRGDPLLTYDTTLTQIQLERAEIELAQQELLLSKAERDLEIINGLRPSSEDDDYDDYDYDLDDLFDDVESEPEDAESEPTDEEDNEEEESYEPQETGVRLGGSGSIDDPYIYLWSTNDALTERELLAMFTEDGQYPEKNTVAVLKKAQTDSAKEIPPTAASAAVGSKAAFIFTRIGFIPVNVWAEEVEWADEVIEEPAQEVVEDPHDTVRFDVETADEVVEEPVGIDESHFYDDQPQVESEQTWIDPSFFDDPTLPQEPVEEPVQEVFVAPEVDPNAAQSQAETEPAVSEDPVVENDSEPEDVEDPDEDEEDDSDLDHLPNEVYVVLELHKYDNEDAPLIQSYGMHLIRAGRSVAIRLVSPEMLEGEDSEEGDDEDDGGDEADAGDAADDAGDDGAYSGDLPDGVDPIGEDEAGSESDAAGMEGTDSEGDAADDLADMDDSYGEDDFDEDYGYEDEEDEDEDDVPSLSDSSIDPNGYYTAKEIEEMRLEKQKEVRDETISYKMKVINLKEMKQEMAGDSVRSKVDGVVKTVRDPEAASDNSDAVIVVSGGGGYSVTVAVSELELPELSLNQGVEVSSFTDDSVGYRGYIDSIGDYPTSAGDSWSSGNPNVSYYPCTVNISDEAEFRDGDYVGVKYDRNAEGKSRSFYLEAMYVRSDSGGRYVYVRGEDGKLEKRYVVTGKSPDTYTYEIRGGITPNDFIAFPYGSNVKEGAATEEATLDDLYA